MNIQIFGRSKCFDTKKAERYFKERRIRVQQIDLPRYGMSGGEFDSVLRAVGGVDKLIDLMKTYFFNLGGMEMQMNIISSQTMRDAQAHPENYKDLVVRIAGFSAYFVEVYKAAQDDLIRRTELNL